MKPIIVVAIIAVLVYICTYWSPLEKKHNIPDETSESGSRIECAGEVNETQSGSANEPILLPSQDPQYVNAEENQEQSQNYDNSNSSYVLQSGFQADQSVKNVYNGISNIEQNEMFAKKAVGNSKSRSITDDFNLKYMHTLNAKR